MEGWKDGGIGTKGSRLGKLGAGCGWRQNGGREEQSYLDGGAILELGRNQVPGKPPGAHKKDPN